MRNLTIKRTKSFVGALGKMKVYIEDPVASELTINGVPCRKIGQLKNGEEKIFQIGETAAKVFVIADKLSRNYANEYYPIPEGREDIVLSGKNRYNPFAGNPFRFDNNESQEVKANRKKVARKGLLVFVLAVVVGVVIGYFGSSGLFSNNNRAKTFTSQGMTITLTAGFVKADVEDYTVAYDSEHVAVFALKEAFAEAEGLEDCTIRQYADLVIEANELSSARIKREDDQLWIEYTYTNPDTEDTYRYLTFLYKADDAFWMVQFAALDQYAQEHEQQIVNWAKSVTFSN